jgi:hypothetical protein
MFLGKSASTHPSLPLAFSPKKAEVDSGLIQATGNASLLERFLNYITSLDLDAPPSPLESTLAKVYQNKRL